MITVIFGSITWFLTFNKLENLMVARLYKSKPKIMKTFSGGEVAEEV